jgi:hypothetical protein
MPTTLVVSCNGPMPISTDQKREILADPRKAQIAQWLATLRSRYLGVTRFNAKVVSIEGFANYPGVRSKRVRLSFSVVDPARYIDTSLAADNEAGSPEAFQKLLAIGFEKKRGHHGWVLFKASNGAI